MEEAEEAMPDECGKELRLSIFRSKWFKKGKNSEVVCKKVLILVSNA
jgi:hypothetical protein